MLRQAFLVATLALGTMSGGASVAIAQAEAIAARYDIQVFDHTNSPLPRSVYEIATTSDGTVWFPGRGVIVSTVNGRWHLISDEDHPALSFNHTETLAAPDGSLWVLSHNDLLPQRIVDGRWDVLAPDNTLAIRGSNIVHDPAADGSLWVEACNDGLMRYRDGRWAEIALPDYGEYWHCRGYETTATADGAFWVFGETGIWVYREAAWTAYTSDTSAFRQGARIAIENGTDNSVWALGEGGLFHIKDGALTRIDTNPLEETGDPDRIYAASDGSLWALLGKNGAARFTDGTWQVFSPDRTGLPDGGLYDPVETVDGAIWFDSMFGLMRFDGEAWQAFTPADSPFPDDRINAKFAASDGALWVSTDLGLARYEAGRWDVLTTDNSALPDNEIGYDFAEAGDGALWFKVGDTIARIVVQPFDLTVAGTAAFTGDYGIEMMTRGRDGTLWISTYDDIIRIDPGEPLTATTPLGLPDAFNAVLPMGMAGDAEGGLWIAAGVHTDMEPCGAAADCAITLHEGGLIHLKGGTPTALTPENSALPPGGVHAVALSDDGTLWAGTDAGLFRYRNGAGDLLTAADGYLAGEAVYAVAIAPDGAVWAGGEGGLARIAGDTSDIYTGDDTPGLAYGVRHLAVAPDGVVWFAANYGDLGRFHKGRFRVYGSTNSGLPDDGVEALVLAADGAVWIASDDDLVRFADDAWRIISSATVEPDTGDELSLLAALPDGSVWAAKSGYTSGATVRFSGAPPAPTVTAVSPVTTSGGRTHTFAVRGADPSYQTGVAALRYRWVVARGDEIMRRTTTLDPFLAVAFDDDGAYRIEARAASPDGSLSAPAVFAVTVALPK